MITFSFRYLVNFLNIEKKGDEDICLSDEVHGRLMDQIMTGASLNKMTNMNLYLSSLVQVWKLLREKRDITIPCKD